jgi:hypothetical protein
MSSSSRPHPHVVSTRSISVHVRVDVGRALRSTRVAGLRSAVATLETRAPRPVASSTPVLLTCASARTAAQSSAVTARGVLCSPTSGGQCASSECNTQSSRSSALASRTVVTPFTTCRLGFGLARGAKQPKQVPWIASATSTTKTTKKTARGQHGIPPPTRQFHVATSGEGSAGEGGDASAERSATMGSTCLMTKVSNSVSSAKSCWIHAVARSVVAFAESTVAALNGIGTSGAEPVGAPVAEPGSGAICLRRVRQ